MARPVKFTSPDEFEAIADAYFAEREAKEQPFTVNGLALALGLCRQSLLNYGAKPEFLDAVKAIRARLEDHWEMRLAGGNAAGTIFWLKNQGWSDKTETELYGRGGGPLQSVSRIERVIVDPANTDT